MDGIRRPQLHSHNRIINLKAIGFLEARYDRNPKSEMMSPNPTHYDPTPNRRAALSISILTGKGGAANKPQAQSLTVVAGAPVLG